MSNGSSTYIATAARQSVLAMHNFELIRLLQQDFEGEVGAIEQYQEHLKHITDARIRAQIQEIIQDEQDHERILQGILDKLNGR